jgi:hypothetical protein
VTVVSARASKGAASRRPAFAALIAAFLGIAIAPVAAAETSGRLREILALAVPALARQQVYFTDLGAAAALAGERGAPMLRRFARRFMLQHFTVPLSRALAEPAPWQRATGFALDDLDALATFGVPPRQSAVYRLAPSAPPAAALESAWSARGFRRIAAGAVAIWGRGEPLRMDFARRDPADPFGGEFGRGSFLLPLPPLLIEAGHPEVLAEAAKNRAAGGHAARADVAALLRVLDQRYAGDRLIGAVLFADTEPFAAREGIARYTALLIADLERAGGAETALLVAFADCAAARAAQAEIERRWPARAGVRHEVVPRWTVAGEASPCPLHGAVPLPGAAAGRNHENPPFNRLLAALFRAELDPLLMRRAR